MKTRLLSSIKKANRVLDYAPHQKFEEGIRQAYNWFGENWENIKRSAEFSRSTLHQVIAI